MIWECKFIFNAIVSGKPKEGRKGKERLALMNLTEWILQQLSELIWVGQCHKARVNSVTVIKINANKPLLKKDDVLAMSCRKWMWWQSNSKIKYADRKWVRHLHLRWCWEPTGQESSLLLYKGKLFLLIVKRKSVITLFSSKLSEFQFG